MSETIGGLVLVGIMVISTVVASIMARKRFPIAAGQCYYGADANHPYREWATCKYWFLMLIAGSFLLGVLKIILDPRGFLYWLVNG